VNTVVPAAPSIGTSLLSLLFVLGLIVALGWLYRRMPRRGGSRGGEQLRIRATLSLGMKERLVLVEAAGKNLLLGVTPTSVTCLHQYEGDLPESMVEPLRFSHLLLRVGRSHIADDAR
jgi:flagellar protein FliO/FliZ